MRPRASKRAPFVAAIAVALSACGSGASSQTPTNSSPTTTVSFTSDPASTSIAPSTDPLSTSIAPSTDADRQAELDRARTSFGAPGAIALLREGSDEWLGVSGVADLAGTALTSGSRFRVGSITKTIVAALVLDSVVRGDLSLDDRVADLLPGVVDPEPPITLRMLLDHTSGIFNVGDEGDIIADIDKLTDPAMHAEMADLARRYLEGERVIVPDRLFVALAQTHDPYFAPGAGYHYSNVNYQLAGMVLERVTGSTLAELLQTRVVEPLGLRRTTVAPHDASAPEMRGYSGESAGSSLVDLTDDLLAIGNGASGGVISTADELLTIMQAIVSGGLVSPPLVLDMMKPTVQSGDSYGLGISTYYLSCGTFFGHGGAIDGTQSIAIVTADGTAGVVVAMNLRTTVDPNLLALAESLLCDD